MKKHIALLLAVVLLLSACSAVQPNGTAITSDETKNTALEPQDGTTVDPNETTASGSEETGDTEAMQGIQNTEGTEGVTTEPTTGSTEPTQGDTQPTQDSTQPTEGNINTPTEGARPTETEPPTTTTPPATEPAPPTEPVEVKLSVTPSTLNLVVGNTSTLTASYNGTGTLSWSTNNASVATVSNGKVTAKAAGTAKITVTDGSKSATCTVTVTAPAPTEKTLKINTKNKSTVFTGETLQIDYTYSGDKSELTWSSNNTSKLTVDSNGLVTGKSAGSAIVKVTNGTTTCRITIVVEASENKATSLKDSEHNAPLYDGVVKYAGDYMNFKVNVQPDESNPNIVVTSSNTSVVSVSWNLNYSNINVVTLNFKSAGSATVTITSADGAASESYRITVKSDYACNPGSGLLTPEEFVYCYNQISKANGMSISGTPSGYLVLTLSSQELTWATVRRNAEGGFHSWWLIGYRTMLLTYEGTDENGNHVFYERGY